MQEQSKKPHSNHICLTFNGPAAMKEQALTIMYALGFEAGDPWLHQINDTIYWRKASQYKVIHSGAFLTGARSRVKLTQTDVAERTGIPRRHLIEMEMGKRPIDETTAHKLAAVLQIDPKLLLTF